ncbi:Peptidyl-prolyl cis-trans isomerase cyp15 [Tilletia horrida]|uniref:peptidylprolyl isomerase n=1 Tax=Tilletia horrida TaxID=155126 RepID=A0AAN6G9X8_9BASI|nr:Peptidyl-prolyl cis-trans isomerase cyp15 [Tilletia horrida]
MPVEKRKKRTRRSDPDVESGSDGGDAGPPPPPAAAADGDESEDDIGPMPPPPGNGADDSDDDVGPQLPGAAPGAGDAGASAQHVRKKRKVLPYESLYLDHLPSADRYSKSFMHRDTVNFVAATPSNTTDFIVTTSVDGHVKFWKKQDTGIEFVKHYRAHLAPITGVSMSADGAFFASISSDGTAKIFDVANFDMINMLTLGYTPRACCWVHKKGRADSILAISEEGKPTIRLYDGRGDGTAQAMIEKLHRQPCHLLAYNEHYDCVVSADIGGMIEYWSPRDPYDLPSGVFELKSTTDLFDFKKHFVTLSTQDRQVRLFHFATGKLKRKYDESTRAMEEMQQAGTAIVTLDGMEFGRRLALENELDKLASNGGRGAADGVACATGLPTATAAFDESGNFLLYATMLGIKVVNTVTNKVSRLLGKDETSRFLNLSIFQGAPAKKAVTNIALMASDNPLMANKEQIDPTLFCTAYKRARFYLFTREEPDSDTKGKAGAERDVFNERPTREEQYVATAGNNQKKSATATSAILHTTKGDIHLRLFPDLTPKTVENFVGLAKKTYYDNVIFHRVITKFMIQTGDPLGDGTGGESLWGGTFEDEIVPQLRHDKPYTLSMANAGPGTNGSQFFITTVPTPHLDNKHTVFGRAVGGFDVIHAIENARTGKDDKPREDIKIINVSLSG